jgi:UV excision repair protein RAD23
MKLVIKSLKQVPYDIEIESDQSTVLDVKKAMESGHGFDHTSMKLVFNGSVLDDTKAIGSYNIKEGNVVVMMSSKVKPVNMQKEEAKVEEKPSETTTSTTNVKTENKPAEKKEKDYSAQVKELMDMGFPKTESEAAIKAARGDISIACEFLYNGIPENLPMDEGAEDVGGSEGPAALLKSISSIVKVMCYNNPSQLQNILLSLQQSSPEVFELIRAHEDEFKALIQQPISEEDMRVFQQFSQGGQLGGLGGGLGGSSSGGQQVGGQSSGGQSSGGQGGRRDVIRLSQEDYEAVNRLKEMGFSEIDAAQAFFACDKNEELAANLLFDNKLKEQEHELYIDCILNSNNFRFSSWRR